MSDLLLILLMIVLTYFLFMSIILFIGTLLFPVLSEEELKGHIPVRKGIRKDR